MRFLLTFSIICFYSAISIAQNAIGASYGLRAFPFQANRPYTLYVDEGKYYPTEYNVTITGAPEHVANFFFELSSRSEKRKYHVGINSYSAIMDFKKMTSQSWGEAGVNGADGYYNTFTQRGRYSYSFVGLEFGTTHYGQLSSGNYSFVRGFLVSANFLVHEKTSNKEYIASYHSSSTIFSGPDAGTYSNDTTIRTQKADDLKISAFNLKLEFFLGFSCKANNNVFSLTSAIGISTASRVLSPNNFNLYLCPRFSYTRILQKRKND